MESWGVRVFVMSSLVVLGTILYPQLGRVSTWVPYAEIEKHSEVGRKPLLDDNHVEIEQHLEMGHRKRLVDDTQVEITDQHLDKGRKLLAAGQLAEALSHYHSAVERDPENYLTYYKRAAVFLAMGKFKSALPDLTRAVQLKPDFLAVSSHQLHLKD